MNTEDQRFPMMHRLLTVGAYCAAAVLACTVGPKLLGQAVPNRTATTPSPAAAPALVVPASDLSNTDTEKTVVMNPFVVESTAASGGYIARPVGQGHIGLAVIK